MPHIRGRVTKDAEVRNLDNGREVVNFSVAVNEKYKTKDGTEKERIAFFNCAYWFDADMAKHLTKGRLVEMSGWITAEAYLKDNDPKGKLVMEVQGVKFPYERKKSPSAGATEIQQDTDELPF